MTEKELRAAWVQEPPRLTGKVRVVDYDPEWPRLYRREAERIRAVLGERVVRLEHIGSTSVPGLAAKPIIDVLLVVPDSADEPAYVPDLEAAGYVLVIREPGRFQHRAFKGPDTDVNLHVYPPGCQEIERYLLFRDRLPGQPGGPGATSRPSASWPSGTGPTSSSTPTPSPRWSRRSSPGPGRGLRKASRGVHNSFTAVGSIGNDRSNADNEEDAMRRMMVVGAVILAVLAVIGIGVAAYSAGVDEGISRELAQSGDTDQVVRVVGHGWGYGYGRGFGFPFGLILFPLFVIGIVLLVRGAFARGRWGGRRGGGARAAGSRWPGRLRPSRTWGGPAAFDEYHRRLHEQPGTPAAPGDAPPGAAPGRRRHRPGTA